MERSETNVQTGTPAAHFRLNRPTIEYLLLVLILLLGAYFRFTGLDWDASYHLHPDERFLTDTTSLLKPAPDPLTYLRTSESPMNPYNVGKGFYVYGNFPMTVTRFTAEWVNAICALLPVKPGTSAPPGVTGWPAFGCRYNFAAYDGVHLLGRFLSGLLDLATILFTFLVGRRLYDGRVGLLGALLYALAVLPIQQAHFYTMDSWAAALATMTLYAAVRANSDFGGELQNPKSKIQNRWWILFGFGLGLTVASRVNVAPLALMAGVAAVVWLARRLSSQAEQERPAAGVLVQQAISGVLIAAAVSILTFRLAQPYAFADSQIARQASQGNEPGFLTIALQSVVGLNPQWLSNLAEIQRLQSPDASFPPALQWTDRAPILFPLTNMVLYGMGVTAGIAAFGGLAWALWRILRGRPDWTAHALPVAWSGLYFLFMGTRWVKSMRYFLPIYPMLLLLAAWAVFELWKRIGYTAEAQRGSEKRVRVLRVSAVVLLTVLVVLPSLLWANAFVQIYQTPVTRVAASGWMLDNIRSGATLLYEANGQPYELQLPLKGCTFEPNGPPVFLTFSLPPAANDPAAPLRVTAVRFNFLTDPENDADTERLQVSLDAAFGRPEALTEAEASFDLRQERQEVVVDLPDVELLPNTTHTVLAAAGAGGRVTAGTSVILNEHWDDPLPVRYEGKDPFSAYVVGVDDPVLDVHGQIPITNPDSEEKRLAFLRWLDSSDVVVLSSQRAVWSTPRLALTYPMTTRYYQALFSGELGFALAGQFHADFHVGPLYISDTGGRLRWGAPPEVGWPPPGDLAVEEAFSVYDHPPVWIFVKTDAYHPDKVRQVLESVDLNQVVFMNPGQATKAANGLQLSREELAIQRANGSFRSVFDVDGLLSRRPAVAAVVWWAAVIVLGWLTFPISFVVFRGLSDRGYALSRILGLLWVSYFGWLMASLKVEGRPWLPFTRATLLLGLGLMVLLSLVILIRQRQAIVAFVREQRSTLLVMELVGVGLYLLFILIRLGNPDAWDVIWGGEKPMDLSYFTAVLKSTSFPPYDPWFAGGYINYYYYGFVYVGALTKLLGVVPAVAYNLIVPMLFSFTGLGAFAMAYNLVASGRWQVAGDGAKSKIQNPKSKALAAGLVAMTLCVLLGNLAEVGVMLGAWQRASDSTIHTGIGVVDTLWRTIDGGLDVTLGDKPVPMYPGDWFWTATRAINVNPGETAPITEFPFFTFLYADLHAHMIALPLTLLALGWALAHALEDEGGGMEDEGKIHPSSFILLHFLVGGLATGALRATNTWDWPTYLLIGVLAVFYSAIRKQYSVSSKQYSVSSVQYSGDGNQSSLNTEHWSLITGTGTAVLQAAVLVILSVLAFLPFAQNYGVGYTSFALWPGSYTFLKNYLAIYGLFLFFVLTHLAREFRDWSGTWTQEGLARWRPVSRLLLVTLFLYVVVLLALLIKDYWIGPVVLTLALAAGLLSLRPGLSPARRIVLLLMAMSLALTLMVEAIVLEGDIGRMNTVFKFYLQVWVLLSVTCGAAAVWAWPAVTRHWGPTRRRVWQTILVALLLMAALYPVLATKAKWDVRMSKETPNTLDGMAYMQYVQYEDHGQTIPLRYDYEAIQWMQRNVDGSPLIVEAFSDNPYRSIATRVVMYTGLPTIVGWDWHQRQQRAVVPGSLVQNRIQAVNSLYNTIDAQQALSILQQYGVQYVYVGPLERAYYSPDGLAKFAQMVAAGDLREVYRNEGVTIYEVIRSSNGN